MSESTFRLDGTTVPSRYDIRIEPNLDAETFQGTATIDVEVLERTDDIILHALDLEVSDVLIESDEGPSSGGLPATVEYIGENETIGLVPDDAIEPGRYQISCRFAGHLNDKLVGFYPSTYTDSDGGERTIGATQFESTHARRAFPCFDEPAYKATYEITLVVDAGHTAISNAAEVSRETIATAEGTEKMVVRFAPTMVMSTYLVAWVIGDLEASEPRQVGDTDIRIIARPGNVDKMGFALDTAEAALGFFARYFGIDYPGDKLDLIAIPDFAFGAMENLGCVTFREVLLLVDPDAATQPELQRVADVINHELAHMWFGDLVTMQWWEGLWLNEAFATFMEMLATDDQHPDWLRWTNFGLSKSAAFDVDALKSTRAIEFKVDSPADSEAMFDILTYEKGASVVRMIEQHLGPEVFRSGIAEYISRHQYANTATSDLWDAIETATYEPMAQVAQSWVYTPGFPVITSSVDGKRLALEQRRFRYQSEGDEDGPLWQIPVSIRCGYSGGTTKSTRTLLTKRSASISLDAEPLWVVVNADGTGFFRTIYVGDLLDAIVSAAPASAGAVERFQIADDMWASAVAGMATLEPFIRFTRSLLKAGEDDISVFTRLISATHTMVEMAPASDREYLGRSWARELSEARTRLLEGPQEVLPHLDAMLWGSAIRLAQDQGGLAEARRVVGGAEDVDTSRLAQAMVVIADLGSSEDFADLVEGFRAADGPQSIQRHLNAMTETSDVDDVTQLLDMCVGEIRTQDAPYTIARALGRPTISSRVWDFIESHWDELVDRYPTNAIDRMLSGIRTQIDDGLGNRIENFLIENPPPGSNRKSVDQHLEKMRIQIRFAENIGPTLGAADQADSHR